MYGDIKKAGESSLKVIANNIMFQVLEFGIPIPYETIENESYMKQLRGVFRYNPDMPGAIELVHPNKFMASKNSFT